MIDVELRSLKKSKKREDGAYINLVVPVAHIWYFRTLPNKIGYLLGLPSKKLDMIIYYEKYVVIQPGNALDSEGNPLQKLQFLTEEEYLNILDEIQENEYLEDNDPENLLQKWERKHNDLLSRIDLYTLSCDLRHAANNETSGSKKKRSFKKLQVVEAFRNSNTRIENKPEWMV